MPDPVDSTNGGGAQAAVVAAMPNVALAMSYRLPTFKADSSQDAESYARRFQDYAQVVGLNANDQKRTFGLNLEGVARSWYESIDLESTTMKEVSEMFTKTFAKGPFEKRVDLFNTTQGTEESGESYAHKILRNSRGLKLDDETVMSLIIQGLKTDFKHQVLQYLPFTSTQTLIQKLKNLDMAHKAIGERVQAMQAVPNQSDDRPSQDRTNQTSSFSRTGQADAYIRCFNCNRFGHRKINCRSQSNANPSGHGSGSAYPNSPRGHGNGGTYQNYRGRGRGQTNPGNYQNNYRGNTRGSGRGQGRGNYLDQKQHF